MPTTNFIDNTTLIVASWLNDVDAHAFDQVSGAHLATNITNTPAGNIAATTVQAAINELDTEKINTSAIGVTVQAYDVDTTKNDVANTFTATQTFTGSIVANGGVTNTDAEDLNLTSSSNRAINLQPGGTTRVTVTNDGRLYGSALHNNAGSVTGTGNQYIASGTYTPTYTAITGITSVSASGTVKWTRVGNVVTVTGTCSYTPSTSAGAIQFAVTVPIASNFTATTDAGGNFVSQVGATPSSGWRGYVASDATNDRLDFIGYSNSTSAHTCGFTLQYEIL